MHAGLVFAGADPGFWFGRDTDRRSGGGCPPEGSKGTAPVGVWGRCPEKSEECYVMRLNKNLAITNRSRVSCAHNSLRPSIGINITP